MMPNPAACVQHNNANHPFIKLPDELKGTIFDKLVKNHSAEGEKAIARLSGVCRDLRAAATKSETLTNAQLRSDIYSGKLNTLDPNLARHPDPRVREACWENYYGDL